jgi:hypothetical protein
MTTQVITFSPAIKAAFRLVRLPASRRFGVFVAVL